MTLRDLIHKAGGINSPAMDYTLAVGIGSGSNWTGETDEVMITEGIHRVSINIPRETIEKLLEESGCE